jgi:MoaA/NifB/PqqE/SkfB family radical SAM enzyme
MAVQRRRARSVEVAFPVPQRRPVTPIDKQCGAGSSGVAVDPYGNVYPCVQWRRPLGNLHDTGMRAIWESSDELEKIRGLTMAAKQLTASLGPAARSVGFCAGLAELTGGSAAGLYPEARRRLRLIEALDGRD